MTNNKIDPPKDGFAVANNSQRTAAKIAGWSGLFTFAIVVFGNFVLLGPLVIPRNAADTARNILAHETQFRAALTCFISYDIGAIVLSTALYASLASSSPEVLTIIMLAFRSLDWPRLFAPGCGSNRTTSREDWLFTV